MAMIRPWRTAVLVAVGWLASLSAITVHASDIRDEANLFTPSVVKSAMDSLNQVEKRDNLSVQIETHATIPADKEEAFGKLAESERRPFYENWVKDRMKATNAKGIFVLITKKPSHLEYHVAKDLKARGFEATTQKTFVGKLLDNFKEKKFDEGLQAATSYLGTVGPTLKIAAATGYHPRPVAFGQNPVHHDPVQHAAPAPMQAGNGGFGIWTWVILAVVVWLVFRVIVGLTRSATGGGMPGPGYGGGQPGYGQPGYGQPGYGGGGGGGFMSNMMGGMAGAVAGNWIYNGLFGGSHNSSHGSDWTNSGSSGNDNNLMGDSSGGSSGDYGGGDFGGGDAGGGDFGGGDFGGGDFGGGGGGDSGGGDF